MPRFIDRRQSDPFEDFDRRIEIGGEADAAAAKVSGLDLSSDPTRIGDSGEDGAGLDVQKDSASPDGSALPDDDFDGRSVVLHDNTDPDQGGEVRSRFLRESVNAPSGDSGSTLLQGGAVADDAASMQTVGDSPSLDDADDADVEGVINLSIGWDAD